MAQTQATAAQRQIEVARTFYSDGNGFAILFPSLIGAFLFPVLGRMMSKGFPPTPFIAMGCIMFIIFGLYGGTMTGDANRWDFSYVLIFRTFGISIELSGYLSDDFGVFCTDFAFDLFCKNKEKEC